MFSKRSSSNKYFSIIKHNVFGEEINKGVQIVLELVGEVEHSVDCVNILIMVESLFPFYDGFGVI
jgi:hypothetical protein